MKSPDMKIKDVPFTEFDLPQKVVKGIETAGFTHCTGEKAAVAIHHQRQRGDDDDGDDFPIHAKLI